MQRTHFTLPAVAIALTLTTAAFIGQPVDQPLDHLVATSQAGELDLSDAQNAKLSKHKARERVSKNEAQKDYSIGADDSSDSLDEEECGTVDIGNVVNNTGFGGPKEIEVIITGDIINANNKCN